jgi:hypothetical protein
MNASFPNPLVSKRQNDFSATLQRLLATTAALWLGSNEQLKPLAA